MWKSVGFTADSHRASDPSSSRLTRSEGNISAHSVDSIHKVRPVSGRGLSRFHGKRYVKSDKWACCTPVFGIIARFSKTSQLEFSYHLRHNVVRPVTAHTRNKCTLCWVLRFLCQLVLRQFCIFLYVICAIFCHLHDTQIPDRKIIYKSLLFHALAVRNIIRNLYGMLE